MTRRTFLAASLASSAFARPPKRWILVHEHILVDFTDAKDYQPVRYDRDDVVRAVLPKLQEIAKLGCVRLHECTPNYLGRDPILLQRLSRESGIDIWTNTGLYAARQQRHLPEFAFRETAQQLANRWIAEHRDGLEGGVKPKFIKIGVDKGPLDEVSRKIVQAGVITSKATGLTLCSHTGDGAAALEQLDIVRNGGLDPKKFVWVHAQNELDFDIHARMARAGCWVEFDGIGRSTAPWHAQCIRSLAKKGLLHRVLISQDAGWYSPGMAQGGNIRGYEYVYTHFLTELKGSWGETLLWKNPRTCFHP